MIEPDYDLALFYPTGHQSHYEYGHPERPERVEVIRKALEDMGVWEDQLHINPVEISEDIVKGIHSSRYLEILESACLNGQHLDADTYTTPISWELAWRTAGGSAAVARAVWQRKAKYGFALCRPPGHHATHDRGMGFCLLNNIALAAEYLIWEEGAKRLAIIDFDLHHGNGTQDIFYKRDDVFYISTHQYPLYPGTGSLEETGLGKGEGLTANFPLPPGAGDEAFDAFVDDLILPLIDQYVPEMVLVSFGFDTHWRDPLGHLQLSAKGYGNQIAKLTQWADENCQGRIALFLEGGYDLEAAEACTQGVVASMLGLDWHDKLGKCPKPEGSLWQSVKRRALQQWKL